MNKRQQLLATNAVAAIVVVAVFAFGMTNKVVPAWEERVFGVFNDLPRWMGRPLESIMWIGTTLGIAVAALVASLLRKTTLSTQLLLGGVITWVAQRALKPVVDRGRPRDLFPDANFWGHLASGGGIPSGHTAMATAICTTIAFHVRWPWKLLCALVALLVGIGRMYTGNHLPLDVVSGAALGWLGAWAGMELTKVLERRRGEPSRSNAGEREGQDRARAR